MSETTDYLNRQNSALLEMIQKKDEYITRLQDEVSATSQKVYSLKVEHQGLRNTVKELVLELVQEGSMAHEDANKFADSCDFELTKLITISATVEFEVEIEVPFDVDPEDVVNSLEYSVDAFDYSIDNFVLDVTNTSWEDTIS